MDGVAGVGSGAGRKGVGVRGERSAVEEEVEGLVGQVLVTIGDIL